MASRVLSRVLGTVRHSTRAVIRSFDHAEFPLELLLERKRGPLSVVLPARETAATVGPIVERILDLRGLVDQVLVVDAASDDGTAEVAASVGAEVVQEQELKPELGAVRGKGDAMWRALGVARGELVAFLDADTRDFAAHFVIGLVGPLIAAEGVSFVKASYRRPFRARGVELPEGGGRVSQLTARPLLEAFYPELADFRQPLAGEVAAPRELLERVPFSTNYAVEIAMLLDVYALVGSAAMAQVNVGERRHSHQPLDALCPMASTVLGAVCERLRRDGRLRAELSGPAIVERPALASLREPAW
jgi:glucosyl-3-phosphoglycerate synthase